MKRILCSLLIAALPFGSVLADATESKNAKVTLVYQHELPNVPGKSIKGVLVEYGPGGHSPGHTHPKSAFIYATVLEGAIRSQVNDGPVTTYKAGQSFSELPGDRHRVSANASATKPAKLLAVFVVDEIKSILTAFPRLEMKRCFADSVCRIVKTRPESTYDNFARDFGERFVPGYKPQSSVDYLVNAPFDE